MGVTIIYAHNANGVILPGRERLRHLTLSDSKPETLRHLFRRTFTGGFKTKTNKQINTHFFHVVSSCTDKYQMFLLVP